MTASPIPSRHLRHVNENQMDSSHRSPMLEVPLDEMAQRLLRQVLNVDADAVIAQAVVLRKLAGLYRTKSEGELRNALARAWELQRRRRPIRGD